MERVDRLERNPSKRRSQARRPLDDFESSDASGLQPSGEPRINRTFVSYFQERPNSIPIVRQPLPTRPQPPWNIPTEEIKPMEPKLSPEARREMHRWKMEDENRRRAEEDLRRREREENMRRRQEVQEGLRQRQGGNETENEDDRVNEEDAGSQINGIRVENDYEPNVDDKGGENEYENTQNDNWGDDNWGIGTDTVANQEETDGNSSPTLAKNLASRLPNVKKIFGPSIHSEVDAEENQRDEDSTF